VKEKEEAVHMGICRHPEVVRFYEMHGYFSPERPLVCVATSEKEDLDITATFLSKLEEYIPQQELLDLAVFEMLAKVVAYRDLPKGYSLKIPLLGDYVVEEVFDLWNGMPAFGLVSQEGIPILLFRGTDPTIVRKRGVASMVTDLDPRGPGYTLYLRAHSKLREWLQLRPARAVGQSLGGILAAYTVLWESRLLHPTKPSVAFNPPGFFKETCRKWDKVQARAPLVTYITEGDAISKIGTVVGEVRRIAPDRPLGPIEAHVALVFASQGYALIES